MIKEDRVNGFNWFLTVARFRYSTWDGQIQNLLPGWKIFLVYLTFNGAIQGMNREFIRVLLPYGIARHEPLALIGLPSQQEMSSLLSPFQHWS